MSTPIIQTRSWLRRRWPHVGVLFAAVSIVAAIFAWDRFQRVEVPPTPASGIEQDVAEAVDRARLEVVKSPDSAAAWGRVGLLLFVHDYYAESRPWLEKAALLDAQDVRWCYYLALAILRAEPEKAVELLQRAVALRPTEPLIRLRLAEALMIIGRVDEAESAFREVLRRSPGEPRSSLGCGQILVRRGDARAAVPLLLTAVKHPYARQSARIALADAHQLLGDDKSAQEQRRLAETTPPDAQWTDPRLTELSHMLVGVRSRIRLGHSLLLAGQPRQAVAHLAQLVGQYPTSAEAHLMLGQALLQTGETKNAEIALTRAAELDAKLADAHFHLAEMARKRGDIGLAESRYQQVLELRPTHALAHFGVGLCRRAMKDRDNAIASMLSAVRHQPGMAAAYLALGDMHLEIGKTDEAIENLETAVRLDPDNAIARDWLAKAKERKKQ